MIRAWYEKGMGPFRWVEGGSNRALCANIAHEMVKEYGQQLKDLQMEVPDFLRKTGLGYLNKIEQQEVIAHILNGNMEKAGDAWGMHLAEDTQWLYNPGNSAQILRGRLGRFLGQFGTWPLSYMEFWARVVGTKDPVLIGNFVKRWTVTNAVLQAVSAEVLGIDMGNWLWTGPFSYTGGPMANMAEAGLNLMQGDRNSFDRLLSASKPMLPFYFSIRDFSRGIARTLDEGDVGEGLKAFAGFRSTKEE